MSRKVTAKQMTLVNFKGIKSLTVDFGQVTEIRGDNATGKSTIADAFNWVLFGKDASGNSDSKFGIKTNDANGNVIPKLDHEVTAVLDIDGETVELRRCYSEDWVTPRGKAEPELKGHSTAYFYNSVPLKESEYKSKINEIINEDLFRMITNPLYFPRLDWQVQREMLLRIAGGITLEDIAKDRAEFSALLAQLSGKSLAEYKAEISARKKKIKEALDLIPARIDEVTRATPTAPDYKALEAEIERLTKELEDVETAISNKAEASRKHYTKVQNIQKEINGYRTEQQNILFAAKQKAQREGYEKNAKTNEAKNKYDVIKREHDNYEASSNREIDDLKRRIADNKKAIEDAQIAVENKRKEWYKRNEDEYQESNEGLICPIYKTLCSDANALQLNSDSKDKAKQTFEEQKAADLERITKEGSALNKKVTELTKYGEELATKLNDLTLASMTKKSEYLAELLRLENIIEENPIEEVNTDIKGEDLPDWSELEDQIKALSASIIEEPVTNSSEITAQKTELTKELDEVKRKLSIRSVIENNEKRKTELLKEEKELAQQKADLEKQEFTADSLVKEQMNEVERRVNLKFKFVRFKMFSQQINGGGKPDCILIGPDGAKFMDTNSAGKITMGLDIINTLCEFNGVFAPIFVDNAEGINKIIPVNSQLIKLIVTTDKELTIV